MMKALIAICIFRIIKYSQHLLKFHCHADGIFHFALCAAWMDAISLHFNTQICSIKVFIFNFTDRTAIYCISKVSTKAWHVKIFNTISNFLIWCKSNADIAVLYFWMCQKECCHCHDLSNTGLVICAKKCCSICSNKTLSL